MRELALALLIAALAPRMAAAQDAPIGLTIVDVQVESGGRSVGEAGVVELVETRIGEPLSMAAVRDTIDHMVGLGRYDDVRLYATPTADGAGVSLRWVLAPILRIADLAVEEFLAGYRDPAARVAFSAAARNIYLEEPDGHNGFWTRMAELESPAMFIWGDNDPLVPLAFSAHVSETLPQARQIVLNDCGHVPQVELPEDTNGLLLDFLATAPSPAHHRAVAHLGRAAKRIREARTRVGTTPAAAPRPVA